MFKRGTFTIATKDGLEATNGYHTADLGLHWHGQRWIITHLNTGFVVMKFKAKKTEAIAIAERVAGLDCWDFVGLTRMEEPHA
jgi:hypothetical protein